MRPCLFIPPTHVNTGNHALQCHIWGAAIFVCYCYLDLKREVGVKAGITITTLFRIHRSAQNTDDITATTAITLFFVLDITPMSHEMLQKSAI